jgi:hypothetical protein
MDECDIDRFGCHPSVHQYHASMEKSWMNYIQPKECKEDGCMDMTKLGKIITKVPSKRQKESLFFRELWSI